MARMTRREFLFLGVAAGATVAVGVVLPLSLVSRDSFDGGESTSGAIVGLFPKQRIAGLNDLETGVPVPFDYPASGQTNYLVKLDKPVISGDGPDENLVAYSRICTHMGCTIEAFDAATSTLGPCPCHFTTFDFATDGGVVLGQASQNLPRILLEVEGDDINAVGVLRLVYGYSNTLLDVPTAGVTG